MPRLVEERTPTAGNQPFGQQQFGANRGAVEQRRFGFLRTVQRRFGLGERFTQLYGGFSRHNAAKQHQRMAYASHRPLDFTLSCRVALVPDFIMIEPVRQRAFQRRFQPLLDAGFRRHAYYR